MNENGWDQMKRLVLHELDSHGRTLEKINDRLSSIEKDIVGLKVRASLWGLAAGGLATGGAFIAKYVFG